MNEKNNGEAHVPFESDEIEMLLPWYYMGTLELSDRERVERYLEAHPEMRAQFDVIETERANTIFVNEAITPPLVGLEADKLVSAARKRDFSLVNFFSRLGSVLAPSSQSPLRWISAALVAVVFVQSAAIGWLVHQDTGGPGYTLASGEQPPSNSGTFALVRIKDDVAFAAVVEEFKKLGVTITDGPNSAGFMTLRIGPEDMSKPEADAFMLELKSQSSSIQFLMPKATGLSK